MSYDGVNSCFFWSYVILCSIKKAVKLRFVFVSYFHLNPDWCAFMTLTATSLPYHLGTKGHKCHTLKEKNINERGGQSLKARFHNYRAYCVLSFLFFFFLVNTFLFLSPPARSLFLSLSFHSSFLLFHPFSIYFFLVYPILFSLYVLALNSWFPHFIFEYEFELSLKRDLYSSTGYASFGDSSTFSQIIM